MVDKPQTNDAPATVGSAATPAGGPRHSPGHRGADMRDTMAEMAERAQIISQEAGSKVAAAMKDVISAAAGITGFAIESARDLVQYMVKRGQMTPEEAEKLMHEAEVAHARRPASEQTRPTATKIAADRAAVAKTEAAARAAAQAAAMPPRTPFRPAPPPTPTLTDSPTKPVAKKPAAKAAKPLEPAKASMKAPAKATKSGVKSPAKVAKAPAKGAKLAKPAPKKGGKR